jgi:hypothetical protein
VRRHGLLQDRRAADAGEYAVWERVRRFVDDEVLPAVNDYWERAEFPRPARAPTTPYAYETGVGTSVTVGSPAGQKAAAASRMAVLEGMGRPPHATAGAAWSLISRRTPGSEAGARGSRLAAAWQPPGSRAS